ncbi:Caspase-6 [Camelus dromedarius]|uniref:Caspase-6 n=1 Tax=Camelus dromedarius TaxID=9838 RepID=A0A5N4EGG5_CAMDR|nr:Caspase-6 [Camelus dromedarius]
MSSALELRGTGCAGEEQNMTETDAFPKREMFDPAEKYKMDHKRRGVALIFNHERFFWHLTLPDRRGTSADRDNLQRSHGEGNHIYAYDAKIEIQTLTGLFKGDRCQSLVGKPKIFIIQERLALTVTAVDVSDDGIAVQAVKHWEEQIREGGDCAPVSQACRGNQHDVPVIPLDVVDHQTDVPDANVTQVDAASVYTLPAGADFLMCYSVAEGYYSHRETVNGSWYIQDLCEMLGKFGSSLEFTELLTLVNRKVSQRRVDFCKDPNAIGKKQVPCFASMLTKKLHFFPKSK